MNGISYNTDQKNTILRYFEQNNDRQLSAAEIKRELSAADKKIALATIYRHLESFEKQGIIRKFADENGKKSCWQFAGGSETCNAHYHLKCERCGKIIHLDCTFVIDIDAHILKEHGFFMNRAKTVFYGQCAECKKISSSKGQL